MTCRGTYEFEVEPDGRLVDSSHNLERLRAVFRDAVIIDGHWGPGDPGDFDYGSWHILCHLAAASALIETVSGRTWLGIGWDEASGRYLATAAFRRAKDVEHASLVSPRGRALIAGSRTLAFVEGTSQGHIAARGVKDPPGAYNNSPRQSFDCDVNDPKDGGVVWEHWCTTRDIRSANSIGSSVLSAYLTLVSVLGGRFVAAAARGRRDHEHPRQLAALVRTGFLSQEEALWDTNPIAIPAAAEALFQEARPADALEACTGLGIGKDDSLRYFMFTRRIASWSPTRAVFDDLGCS